MISLDPIYARQDDECFHDGEYSAKSSPKFEGGRGWFRFLIGANVNSYIRTEGEEDVVVDFFSTGVHDFANIICKRFQKILHD